MATNERTLLQALPSHARPIARSLFELGRKVGAVQENGKVSVSVRLQLPAAGYRAVTLFVVTHRRGGEVYTYWLSHWPPRFRNARQDYERALRRAFGSQIIGSQSARHLSLAQMSDRLTDLEHCVRRAVEAITVQQQRTAVDAAYDETVSGYEGALRSMIVRHRKREARLRVKKILLLSGSGRPLRCEVAACRFDFAERYGALGEGYIQVHHTKPLSWRAAPSETKLADLRVVCPNCHAMIHKGGECRSLGEISRMIQLAKRGAA